MTHQREELAYAAGLFDGEGTIVCQRQARGGGAGMPTLVAAVQTTSAEAANWLYSRFGGSLYVVKRTPKAINRNWRQCYQWRIGAEPAARFLEQLLPWLLIKAPQAERALALRQLCREASKFPQRHPVRREKQSAAHVLREQIISLNRTGSAS